jgi:hypothetical protein
MTLEELDELARLALEVLQEFESRYQGDLTLQVTRPPERAGAVLRLRSETVGSAEVVAEVVNDRELDMFIENSRFDLLLRRGEGASRVLDQVRGIVAAVAEGKFEETVWEFRGQVLRSNGMLTTDRGPVRSTVITGSWIFLPLARKRTIHYPPYR